MSRPDRQRLRTAASLAVISLFALTALPLPAQEEAAHPPPDPTGITASREAAEIQDRLLCMCGTCVNQTLHECTCGTAAAERAKIEQALGAGRSSGEIVEEYINTYGAQVLTTPDKSGFNLFGWMVPFLVAAGGLLALTLVLRGWIRAREPELDPAGIREIDENDRAYRDRLESALRKMDS